MTAPLFSVIIPTYNRPNFLQEAVNSVLTQTIQNFECIVVDDGGNQSLGLDADPRLRVERRRTNGGPAVARNAGIEVAKGRYLCFLDDDDVYLPHRLEVALKALETASVGLCASRYMDKQDGRIRELHGRVSDSILNDLTPNLGAVAIPRVAVKNFDSRYSTCCEDIDWWLRVAQDAEFATVPDFAYLVRRHETPRHRTGKAERIQGGLLLLESHRDYFNRHPKAAAFQWKRIGLTARAIGDMKTARRAFFNSLRLNPRIKTLWHLSRSLG